MDEQSSTLFGEEDLWREISDAYTASQHPPLSLSLSLRLGTGRLGKTREVKEGKGREGAFLSMRIGRSCFSRGKQLIRSFRRRHSFDPSLLLLSSLLWPPASWILHTSGKKGDGTRGGGMAVIRCTETKRGEEAEFRGVDALKGKR